MATKPRGPNLSPNLLSRPPQTTSELQVVADRLVMELTPASTEIILIPVDRTVAQGRAVILARSKVDRDMFGSVIDYEVRDRLFQLVNRGAMPFAVCADVPTSPFRASVVDRAKRLRVDVQIARDDDEFAALRAPWGV